MIITEWHASTGILLVDDEDKILCVSRKDDHTGFSLPGGKLDEADKGDFFKGALRELLEETGYEPTPVFYRVTHFFTNPIHEGFHLNHRKPGLLYYC